ncbi:uncharacterized protein LOC121915566 [Sceloporus undulatus]|uniref:uncharacterized protein LOC121915566 n=1 Tax=Sceloporus undulatus TaxID=8520 RepID=UPI001C4B59CB|nr:uncharacterized protein LOC121915566 [Sceloporus undulatus]
MGVIAPLSQPESQRLQAVPMLMNDQSQREGGDGMCPPKPCCSQTSFSSDLPRTFLSDTMKILAVGLALAIAIGPEALGVRANQPFPSPSLHVLFYGISGLMIDGYVKLTKKLEMVTKSDAGKAVSDQFEKLLEPFSDLERGSAIPAELSEAIALVSGVLWGIPAKGYRTFQDVERHSPANLEHVVDVLSAYLEPTLVKTHSYAEPLLTPLTEKILELDQEMDKRISQAMESLDGQLSFYVKRMEEIGDGLQPLVEEVSKQFRLGLETLNKNAKPYLDPFLEESKKYADSFREWVEAPLYPAEES